MEPRSFAVTLLGSRAKAPYGFRPPAFIDRPSCLWHATRCPYLHGYTESWPSCGRFGHPIPTSGGNHPAPCLRPTPPPAGATITAAATAPQLSCTHRACPFRALPHARVPFYPHLPPCPGTHAPRPSASPFRSLPLPLPPSPLPPPAAAHPDLHVVVLVLEHLAVHDVVVVVHQRAAAADGGEVLCIARGTIRGRVGGMAASMAGTRGTRSTRMACGTHWAGGGGLHPLRGEGAGAAGHTGMWRASTCHRPQQATPLGALYDAERPS